MQVLRVCRFSTFALPPAFPPCCCPLAFQRQVRRLASRISSESYPGYPECVVSCHGADRLANSIRRFFKTVYLHLTCIEIYVARGCSSADITPPWQVCYNAHDRSAQPCGEEVSHADR